MKVVLTILFFLLMAGHVLVLSHSKQDEIVLVQDTPEEKENGGLEEKLGEKEFLSNSSSTNPEAIPYSRSFSTRFIPIQASPLIENQTPPPDQA